MTELEVKENKFYVLTVKQGQKRKITIYNDMDSPTCRVKEYLRSGTSPDDVELVAVEIKADKFEIKGVPWSTIAVGLVKEE